jgi:hypothetical protein
VTAFCNFSAIMLYSRTLRFADSLAELNCGPPLLMANVFVREYITIKCICSRVYYNYMNPEDCALGEYSRLQDLRAYGHLAHPNVDRNVIHKVSFTRLCRHLVFSRMWIELNKRNG